MKILIAALLATFSISLANAQIGFKAGYINSDFKQNISEETNVESESMNGFKVGPTYDLAFTPSFSLQTGLLYSILLNKESESSASVKITMQYLNLPIRATYTYDFGNNLKLFGFAGPQIVYGLSAKAKASVSSFEVNYNFYKGEYASMKRFDIQLGLGAGFQFENFRFKVGYDFGMLNIFDFGDNTKRHRNELSVTLGYIF